MSVCNLAYVKSLHLTGACPFSQLTLPILLTNDNTVNDKQAFYVRLQVAYNIIDIVK